MKQYTHDSDLIAGLHSGEATAIHYLYSSHYRALCYYAERLIHDKQEAEDIAVDTFLKLLNKKADFDNLRHIKSFLYTATRNACFDFLRKEKSHQSSHEELSYLSEQKNEKTDIEMINAEIMQEIYLEIENLPKQCGQVFKFIFFNGMNTSEVADKMGITTKTVLNQKAKAVKLLRVALLKKGLLTAAFFLDLIIKN